MSRSAGESEIRSTPSTGLNAGDANRLVSNPSSTGEPTIERSDLLHYFFEQNPNPMWATCGKTLKFIEVNQAAIKHYGYSREEFLAMSLMDIRPSSDVAELTEYADRIRKRPVPFKGGITDLWRHKKKDGTLIDVKVTWSPIRIKNRIVILSSILDVTEVQQIHQKVTFQGSALNQVSDAVFAVDNKHNITYWNQASERLYGYKQSEVLGKSIEDAIGYEYLSLEDYEKAKAALRDLGFWKGEKTHTTKSKKKLFVDSSISTLRDAKGTLIGMLSVARDITERKRVQQEILRINETLRAIIYASPVAIVAYDLSGRVTIWNPAAERTFGWSEKEMLGHPYSRLVPIEFEPEHLMLHQMVLNGQTINEKELKRSTKNGSLISVSVSTACFHDVDGTVTGVVAVLNDITERKRTEAALRTAKVEAISASRAKSQFVANISHEIRTPLGAILGFAEMMFDAKQTVSERMNCITRIRHNVKNLTNLIDDLLDLSRVEAGKFEVHEKDFLLLPEISEVRSLIQGQLIRKGLGLNISFSGTIPYKIHTDPDRLRQILINILGNAIKFTDRGTIAVNVYLNEDSNLRSPMLCISVSDTGLGISNDDRNRIFEPFAQLDNSNTRRYGGTGLGLNLSRRLARVLGGEVILTQSEPGKGSTFLITIPTGNLAGVLMLESVSAEDLKSKDTVPEKTDVHRLKGMSVLLVEDSQDNQFLISHFLQRNGAIVDLARNGKEGTEMAQGSDYDVVLMDIQMPVLDGYQAIAHLRKEGYKIPIIALTAHAMKEERERCFHAGCSDYLSKPIDAATLVGTVARFGKPATL